MARQLDVMVVRIPPEVKEFDKKAKEFDLSMSQIARRLVEDWLKKDPQKACYLMGFYVAIRRRKIPATRFIRGKPTL